MERKFKREETNDPYLRDKNNIENEMMINGSLAVPESERNTGVPQTLKMKTTTQLRTCNGDALYDKLLTGFKPILFPTAVSENCCFEYRFTIKDIILPSELPNITNLYFRDLVVKVQDMFTQMSASECIKDSVIYAYEPYSAVLAQDENGIEIQYHNYNNQLVPVITSERLINRDSSPLFVVSSNLKFNKQFNLEITSNSYQAIIVNGIFKNHELVGRSLKTQTFATAEQLKQAISFDENNTKNIEDGVYCLDIILCDMLIFCLKSFDLTKKPIEEITPNELAEAPRLRSIPIGWLSPEEKLKKFGTKGVFREEYGTTNPLPNSLFILVDATAKSQDLFKVGRPTKTAFIDENAIVCPVVNCYSICNMLLSIRTASDN